MTNMLTTNIRRTFCNQMMMIQFTQMNFLNPRRAKLKERKRINFLIRKFSIIANKLEWAKK